MGADMHIWSHMKAYVDQLGECECHGEHWGAQCVRIGTRLHVPKQDLLDVLVGGPPWASFPNTLYAMVR